MRRLKNVYKVGRLNICGFWTIPALIVSGHELITVYGRKLPSIGAASKARRGQFLKKKILSETGFGLCGIKSVKSNVFDFGKIDMNVHKSRN